MKSIFDILNTEYPDTSLTTPPIFVQSSTFLLHGGKGIGKTFLTLQIAWELAHGKPLFGTYPVKRPLKVGYYQVEVAEALFKIRAAKLDWEKPIYMLNDGEFKLDDDGKETVSQDMEIYGLDVLLFDPLYRIHRGGENAKEDVESTIDILASFKKQYGCLCGLVHHDKKPSFDKNNLPNYFGIVESRGSGAIIDYMDTIFSARASGKTGLKVHFFTRHAEQQDPIELVRLPEGSRRFFLPIIQGDRAIVCVTEEIKAKGGEISHDELSRVMDTEYGLKEEGLRSALNKLQEQQTVVEVENKQDRRKKVWKIN